MIETIQTYTYDEITVGQVESFTTVITQEKMDAFRTITGDVNPLHADPSYAAELGHPQCVAFGMLTSAFISTLSGVYLPGKRSLIHSVECKMVKPVYVGDTLTVTGKVIEKNDTFRYIVEAVTIRNQNGDKVLRAKLQVGVSQ